MRGRGEGTSVQAPPLTARLESEDSNVCTRVRGAWGRPWVGVLLPLLQGDANVLQPPSPDGSTLCRWVCKGDTVLGVKQTNTQTL